MSSAGAHVRTFVDKCKTLIRFCGEFPEEMSNRRRKHRCLAWRLVVDVPWSWLVLVWASCGSYCRR